LPYIFPHDEIVDYLILPSRITSPPKPLIGSVVCDLEHESPATSINHFNDTLTLQYTDKPAIVDCTTNSVNNYVSMKLTERFTHLLNFRDYYDTVSMNAVQRTVVASDPLSEIIDNN